jgi:hypothetical protein
MSPVSYRQIRRLPRLGSELIPPPFLLISYHFSLEEIAGFAQLLTISLKFGKYLANDATQ